MSNPSIMPDIDALFSQMTLTVYALHGRPSMGLGAAAAASIAESVASGGSEVTLVESMIPRSQLMDSVAVARIGCAIIV